MPQAIDFFGLMRHSMAFGLRKASKVLGIAGTPLTWSLCLSQGHSSQFGGCFLWRLREKGGYSYLMLTNKERPFSVSRPIKKFGRLCRALGNEVYGVFAE